jgi:hypothetical protein
VFTPDEREEIRQLVHWELATIEQDVRDRAGSYNYLCNVGGVTMFTHRPMGAIIHSIPHFD